MPKQADRQNRRKQRSSRDIKQTGRETAGMILGNAHHRRADKGPQRADRTNEGDPGRCARAAQIFRWQIPEGRRRWGEKDGRQT